MCRLTLAGDNEFEIWEEGTTYVVNLRNGTCDCRVWAVSGIPCKHALTCIFHNRENPENYCHPYLTTEAYMRTYSDMIHPLPDESSWSDVEHETVEPPYRKRMPGRPKKCRRREPDEPVPHNIHKRSTTLRCCVCKEFGHNKRTCSRISKN